ncbi:MAG: preprotein translocase subunit SecE [Actinobacteria bacterium]|nr:preprotein translocase subunit SecE [Actinomycetota bacterium]
MNRDRKSEEEPRTPEPVEAVPVGSLERTDRERTSPAQFLREVRSELKKVAWPGRKEVASYTMVVLVTTAVLTAFVFGLDEIIRNALLNIFE